MRDISGAEFRFAKTLTLPFFGSGMVELPPEGAKRVKNSRKMQMVFFVFYGRVTVDVGTPTTSFSIGKGGMWHVPRGKKSLFFHYHRVILQALHQCNFFCDIALYRMQSVLEYFPRIYSAAWTPHPLENTSGNPFERRTTSNF